MRGRGRPPNRNGKPSPEQGACPDSRENLRDCEWSRASCASCSSRRATAAASAGRATSPAIDAELAAFIQFLPFFRPPRRDDRQIVQQLVVVEIADDGQAVHARQGQAGDEIVNRRPAVKGVADDGFQRVRAVVDADNLRPQLP